MTTIKLLSAGVIATAMLATPVMARENYLAKRHVAAEANTRTSPTAHYIDGRVGIAAPRVEALQAPPDGKIATSAITRLYAERATAMPCSQALQGKSGASRIQLE